MLSALFMRNLKLGTNVKRKRLKTFKRPSWAILPKHHRNFTQELYLRLCAKNKIQEC